MDGITSDAGSLVASPEQRPTSPSPSTAPSVALEGVPPLDRASSTPSFSSESISTLSSRSRESRLSDGSATIVKRRGYMRPQGTAFADSARSRDSVMSLGSIAHMQYYFARTGLLDGKGGQLAKDKKKKDQEEGKENVEPASASTDSFRFSTLSLGDTNSVYAVSEGGNDQDMAGSPNEYVEDGTTWPITAEPPMLPPTVSTYKQKPSYTEPLPDMPVLRRELKESLQDSCKVLEENQKNLESKPDVADNSAYHEVHGMHLLDIITLAIRAAKNYYTTHPYPQKLYAIKSEKDIRADLYRVLDVLKRMASRTFRGGMRMEELTDILLWIESIDALIKKEEQREQEEAAERETWVWRYGEWEGREREREWLFLKSFDRDETPLPQWPESPANNQLPSEFLRTLQDGQRLVKLHNSLVARSFRRFGEIKTWHTDNAKHYRMAENLRFWIKAAELRWEIKLSVPVADVVHEKDTEAWRKLDDAVLKWCQGVREELTQEWKIEESGGRRRGQPPELKVEYLERSESDGNGGGGDVAVEE